MIYFNIATIFLAFTYLLVQNKFIITEIFTSQLTRDKFLIFFLKWNNPLFEQIWILLFYNAWDYEFLLKI